MRASRVSLWGNEFDGPIPEEIGNCARLQTLYLDKNRLSGEIPAALGRCTKLQDLNQDQLTGEIPEALGQCALQRLKLERNQLTGALPPFCESGLLKLSYDRNKVSDHGEARHPF